MACLTGNAAYNDHPLLTGLVNLYLVANRNRLALMRHPLI
jgi:hypothetical protein